MNRHFAVGYKSCLFAILQPRRRKRNYDNFDRPLDTIKIMLPVILAHFYLRGCFRASRISSFSDSYIGAPVQFASPSPKSQQVLQLTRVVPYGSHLPDSIVELSVVIIFSFVMISDGLSLASEMPFV